MTRELGSLILVLVGLCWMGLVIYYAALGVRSVWDHRNRIRESRRRRRCASGHHDRTAYDGTSLLLREYCVDCKWYQVIGYVWPSAECHATVKRRDAA